MPKKKNNNRKEEASNVVKVAAEKISELPAEETTEAAGEETTEVPKKETPEAAATEATSTEISPPKVAREREDSTFKEDDHAKEINIQDAESPVVQRDEKGEAPLYISISPMVNSAKDPANRKLMSDTSTTTSFAKEDRFPTSEHVSSISTEPIAPSRFAFPAEKQMGSSPREAHLRGELDEANRKLDTYTLEGRAVLAAIRAEHAEALGKLTAALHDAHIENEALLRASKEERLRHDREMQKMKSAAAGDLAALDGLIRTAMEDGEMRLNTYKEEVEAKRTADHRIALEAEKRHASELRQYKAAVSKAAEEKAAAEKAANEKVALMEKQTSAALSRLREERDKALEQWASARADKAKAEGELAEVKEKLARLQRDLERLHAIGSDVRKDLDDFKAHMDPAPRKVSAEPSPDPVAQHSLPTPSRTESTAPQLQPSVSPSLPQHAVSQPPPQQHQPNQPKQVAPLAAPLPTTTPPTLQQAAQQQTFQQTQGPSHQTPTPAPIPQAQPSVAGQQPSASHFQPAPQPVPTVTSQPHPQGGLHPTHSQPGQPQVPAPAPVPPVAGQPNLTNQFNQFATTPATQPKQANYLQTIPPPLDPSSPQQASPNFFLPTTTSSTQQPPSQGFGGYQPYRPASTATQPAQPFVAPQQQQLLPGTRTAPIPPATVPDQKRQQGVPAMPQKQSGGFGFGFDGDIPTFGS